MMMEDNYLNNLLFADNKIILSESEVELQLSLYTFYTTALNFNCEVSTKKTNIMVFKEKEPVWSKIVVDGLSLNRSAAVRI